MKKASFVAVALVALVSVVWAGQADAADAPQPAPLLVLKTAEAVLGWKPPHVTTNDTLYCSTDVSVVSRFHHDKRKALLEYYDKKGKRINRIFPPAPKGGARRWYHILYASEHEVPTVHGLVELTRTDKGGGLRIHVLDRQGKTLRSFPVASTVYTTVSPGGRHFIKHGYIGLIPALGIPPRDAKYRIYVYNRQGQLTISIGEGLKSCSGSTVSASGLLLANVTEKNGARSIRLYSAKGKEMFKFPVPAVAQYGASISKNEKYIVISGRDAKQSRILAFTKDGKKTFDFSSPLLSRSMLMGEDLILIMETDRANNRRLFRLAKLGGGGIVSRGEMAGDIRYGIRWQYLPEKDYLVACAVRRTTDKKKKRKRENVVFLFKASTGKKLAELKLGKIGVRDSIYRLIPFGDGVHFTVPVDGKLAFVAVGRDGGGRQPVGDGPQPRSVAINPPDTTWLSPYATLFSPSRYGGMLGAWTSMLVPKRFLFRELKRNVVVCTDQKGEVVWKRQIDGWPLWDYNYDCRVFVRIKDGAVTMRWISPVNGKQTGKTVVQMPRLSWRVSFVLGAGDGDFVCRWEEGQMPFGRPSAFTFAPLRFYRKGKRVAIWAPAKAGFRLLPEVGRRADGTYVVIAEKNDKGRGVAEDPDGKRIRLVFSADGKLLKSAAATHDEQAHQYAGDFEWGLKEHGIQLKGNVLVITKEKVRPNVLNSRGHLVAYDRRGKEAPVTVLWELKMEHKIWGVSAEHEGSVYVATVVPDKQGGKWQIVSVSLKERKIVSVTPLATAGHGVMGPEKGVVYASQRVKFGEQSWKSVLWRHRLK